VTTRRARRMLSGVAAAAVAVTLALVAAGCGSDKAATSSSSAPTDGTLVVGLLGDIGQPPDPDVYYASNGLAIVLNAYEGLVQYPYNTGTTDIAPRLATSWKLSADKRVYTFQLRRGVKFHDGTTFTSASVKASLDRRRDVKGGGAYMVAGVQSIDASQPYTAVVTLKEPNSAFLDYLASPFGPKMESPDGLKKNAGKDNAQTFLQSHDLGSGPYELATAEPGSRYGMTQFDGYWGTKAPFTKIELPIYKDASALELAFDKGDVHLIAAALPSTSLGKYADSAAADSYFLPTLQSAIVNLNPKRDFFANKEARLAFRQFFDREKLISQVLGKRSEIATTMYAKGMVPGGKDVQDITYDPAVFTAYAKTLPPGTELSLGYVAGNQNAEQIANIVAAQLQAIGLKSTAQGYPIAQVFGWIDDPTKGPDAFIDGNNGPDGGNPYMWGHVFWDASGGINYFLCEDKNVNAKLDEAVKTGDKDLFAEAGVEYSKTGCSLHFSYNKNWVLSQTWLQGVAEASNISANELDFSKLTIAK
jgi:peptide/nickel transport system substrate-binding protein